MFIHSVSKFLTSFTRNPSLRRHRLTVYLNTSFNCLTCNKTFKRQEDLGKHAQVCLRYKLDEEDSKMLPLQQFNKPNRVEDGLNVIRGDLTLSDSDEDNDQVLNIMANHLNAKLLLAPTRSIETNTDLVRVFTADKATSTEHLIILSPDKLISFKDGLTIASFGDSLKIFVETLNSTIVMSKPNLETPPEPTTQIGLLKVQPTGTKANQTTLPHSESKNVQLIEMCSRNPQDPACLCQSLRE